MELNPEVFDALENAVEVMYNFITQGASPALFLAYTGWDCKVTPCLEFCLNHPDGADFENYGLNYVHEHRPDRIVFAYRMVEMFERSFRDTPPPPDIDELDMIWLMHWDPVDGVSFYSQTFCLEDGEIKSDHGLRKLDRSLADLNSSFPGFTLAVGLVAS